METKIKNIVVTGVTIILSVIFCCLLTNWVFAAEKTLFYEIEFSKEDLSFGESDGYDTVNLPGCVLSRDVGKPQLPLKVLHFVIDQNKEVDRVILITDIKEEIPGIFNIYPAQKSVRFGERYESTQPDPVVYSSFKGYPEERVKVKLEGSLNGLNIATIHIYPLEYIPAQKKLILHRQLKFKVIEKERLRIDKTIQTDRIMSSKSQQGIGAMIEFLNRVVANPQDIKDGYRELLEEFETIDYLIITSQSLKNSGVFQPLIDTKVAKGLSVKIETVETIKATYGGRDTQEKIRNCIKDKHANNGLSWVLLGGDTNIVPARLTLGSYGVLCDMYYSNLDGDWDADGDGTFGEGSDNVDLYPDVFVGRAPVENEAEVRVFVNKILTYKKNVTGYIYKALFLGFADFQDVGGRMKDFIDQQYFPAEFDPIKKLYERNISAYRQLTISAINEGYNIFNHQDHANIDKMGTGNDYLTISDMDGLTNIERPAVLYSVGCFPAAIDYDCIAEHFLNNPNGGGVAFVGNSRYGYHPESSTGLDPEFFKSLFKEGLTHIGQTVADHKLTFVGDIDYGMMRYVLYEINLLGDPEMNIQITRGGENRPPVLNPIGNKTVNEGNLLEFTITASDPDGDSLTYSASNLPPGANFNAGSRTFSWTPAYNQAGIYNNVHFEVSDGIATDSEDITITVNNINRPPVLNTIGNKSVNEGQTLSFTISGSDPDGDSLTYSASNLPQGASFNAGTRTFSWTPAYNQAGTYPNIHFAITDGSLSDSEDITIMVNNVDQNRPPVLDPIGNKSVNENTLLTFTVNATDPDGDNLTYSASNLPQGASFNTASKTFAWTPTYEQAGTYPNVHFEVSDGTGTDSEDITITVNNVNRPPVLNVIGNKSVNEAQNLTFTVSGSDPDGDNLTYSASNLPQGASFNTATRTFSWTPAYDQAGIYNNVHFEVSDGTGTDSEDITITVNNVNCPPILNAIGNKSIDEGQNLSFTVSGSDPDGDSLTYSASNLPQGATFDSATRTFSWTPTYDQAGIYNNVHFEVSDGIAKNSEDITITVNNVNRAPILNAIGNKSVNEGQNLSFTVSGSDPDGDSLTYSASNLPQGASFNTATRTFSWTPAYDQAGIYNNVHFEVSDGTATDSEDITITVNNVNRPPVLNVIGNKSVNEGQNLSFTVSGSDPDGDNLTYSASNLPPGASFNAGSRTFSWTPAYNQAGIYNNVHFEVSDGIAKNSEDITITVNNVNRPPVLNAIGNKSIDEGQNLSFTVSGSDPDGDNLTYSASNLPQGATFDSATRTFSWTPTYDQAGIYNNVHFEVSDGTAKNSEDITITVNNVNRAPILNAIGNKSINEAQTLSFTVSGSDLDGNNLTYSASNLPQGANFDSTTRTFSWTPAYDQAGTYPDVHFEVTDGPLSDSEDITITVNNVNRAPRLDSIGNKSITENQSLTFTVNATDPDGDPLTYSVQDIPNSATFQNQTFTWTPITSDVGDHQLTFIASDGSLSDSETIIITVKEGEEITLKIRFNTDRVSKIGILYISGETNEGAVIKEVKVLDDHNKILNIDMKDMVTINGEGYISGIVIVSDIIKKYPLLSGIKISIMVRKGEKTKEGQTGVARIEPYGAGPDRIGVYNNLFNPLEGEKTLIRIDITEQTHIKINLYDTRGKKIREIADEERGAGICRYYWDGKDDSGNVVGSGLYLVHIEAGDYKKTKKIVVIK